MILDKYMERPSKELFKVWHLVFQKSYDINTLDAINKYKTFKANVAEIKAHNARQESYIRGLNEHSDLTFEEFKAYYNIRSMNGEEIHTEIKKFNNEMKFNLDDYNEEEIESSSSSYTNVKLATVDWNSKLTPVKNQGSCGSCWAFGTILMLESNWLIKNNGTNDVLAPQQLVDCDTGNGGCNGGWYVNAINYFKGKKAALESAYPYKGRKGTCINNGVTGKDLKVTGYKSGNNLAATYALLVKGPVAVAVGVSSSFSSYRSGIYQGSGCAAGINHAVVAIGYSVLNNVEYWLLRNSWGASWGDKGTIKINSAGNDCSVSKYGYQAVLG
jgi:C1A family cysteine protease